MNSKPVENIETKLADITEEVLDNNIDQLVSTVGNMLKSDEITTMNIFSVCVNMMQIVEKYPNLKGPEKKKLVLRALENIMSKNGGNKGLLDLVPSFIDNMISIENKQIKISIDPEDISSCCAGILASFSGQKK